MHEHTITEIENRVIVKPVSTNDDNMNSLSVLVSVVYLCSWDFCSVSLQLCQRPYKQRRWNQIITKFSFLWVFHNPDTWTHPFVVDNVSSYYKVTITLSRDLLLLFMNRIQSRSATPWVRIPHQRKSTLNSSGFSLFWRTLADIFNQIFAHLWR